VLILEGNTASLKMCEKCGFQVEGVLRQSIFKQGRFHSQVVLSLLQEEFYTMIKERGLE
jgi:RimJ/RimL family protein N-acetyltransferase